MQNTFSLTVGTLMCTKKMKQRKQKYIYFIKKISKLIKAALPATVKYQRYIINRPKKQNLGMHNSSLFLLVIANLSGIWIGACISSFWYKSETSSDDPHGGCHVHCEHQKGTAHQELTSTYTHQSHSHNYSTGS